ncbi:MAG: hypothetical protein Q9217_000724 [Psora testacea]
MWCDEERTDMAWEERVWGYTGAGGMIQGFAAGYFLWDLGICVGNVGVFGWGLLAHAVAALVVFSFGFRAGRGHKIAGGHGVANETGIVHLQRPFVNFYAPTFILYELSSPFLNFHWFLDKLHMTGSKPQWYNGILLLTSFCCCRLLWGTYQSIRVYQDVWAGLHYDPTTRATKAAVDGIFEPLGEADEVMRYAGKHALPGWLASVYLTSNILLNTLNFYWFGKMIETVRSRFREPRGKKVRTEGVMIEGLVDSETIGDAVADVDVTVAHDGDVKGRMSQVEGTGTVIEVERKEIRRRRD